MVPLGVHALMREWGCGHGNMQVPRFLQADGHGKVLVDIGLGTGAEETRAAMKRGYTVFAFDPVGAHVERVRADMPEAVRVPLVRVNSTWRPLHVPRKEAPALYLFEAAVGAHGASVHVQHDGDLSTVATHGLSVPMVRLDDCLPAWVQGVHLLKVDTQGYELQVLRGAMRTLSTHRVRYVLFEFSPWLMVRSDFGSPRHLLDFLPALGFVCFDMMGLHNLLPHPQSPLEAYFDALYSGTHSYIKENRLPADGRVPLGKVGPWEDIMCWDPHAAF